MRKIGLAIVALLSGSVAGCAAASDPIPVGPDSFMVTAPETLNGHGRDLVLKAANRTCAAENTHMILRRLDASGLSIGLVFSCVTTNDPEYQRPNLRREPNIIIEERRS